MELLTYTTYISDVTAPKHFADKLFPVSVSQTPVAGLSPFILEPDLKRGPILSSLKVKMGPMFSQATYFLNILTLKWQINTNKPGENYLGSKLVPARSQDL